MSNRKELLDISYHSDDDTGMYRIGEIDWGINGGLEGYLRTYGFEGRKEIALALNQLAYAVEETFRKINIENQQKACQAMQDHQ